MIFGGFALAFNIFTRWYFIFTECLEHTEPAQLQLHQCLPFLRILEKISHLPSSFTASLPYHCRASNFVAFGTELPHSWFAPFYSVSLCLGPSICSSSRANHLGACYKQSLPILELALGLVHAWCPGRQSFPHSRSVSLCPMSLALGLLLISFPLWRRPIFQLSYAGYSSFVFCTLGVTFIAYQRFVVSVISGICWSSDSIHDFNFPVLASLHRNYKSFENRLLYGSKKRCWWRVEEGGWGQRPRQSEIGCLDRKT